MQKCIFTQKNRKRIGVFTVCKIAARTAAYKRKKRRYISRFIIRPPCHSPRFTGSLFSISFSVNPISRSISHNARLLFLLIRGYPQLQNNLPGPTTLPEGTSFVRSHTAESDDFSTELNGISLVRTYHLPNICEAICVIVIPG